MNQSVISSLLNSPVEEERLQGLKLLSRAPTAADLAGLYQALGDESWRVRKEASEIFLALPRAGEMAGEIIELLHSPDNAGLRNTAVEVLVALGRQAVPFLLEELGCADHDVRKFVLDILGEIRDPQTVPPIIESLHDPDDNVRAAAAENLGKIGAVQAVHPLLESLSQGDLLFRFTVLDSLGRIGADVPVERLLAFGGEVLLRKALCDCLGRIGAEEGIPFLAQALTDPLRNVREAAALALERISRHHPAQVEMQMAATEGRQVAEFLTALTEEGSAGVKKAAVKLLGWIGDPRYASRFVSLFADPEIRDSALESLTYLGRKVACSLTDMWPHADGATRTCLALVMGESQCRGGEALLLEGLEGKDPELRVVCARALGKIGGAASIPSLVDLFGDPSEEVRAAARQALSRIAPHHPEKALEALSPLLHDDDARKRTLSVQVMGHLKGPAIENALGLAMKDESSLVRQAAIGAFEGRVGSRLMSGLKLALTDEDAQVRQRAIELIGGTNDPDALSALGPVLEQDDDIWVRAAAVRAIGRFDSPEGVRMAIAALDDPVGLVTIAALEVLSAVAPQTAFGYLEKALAHEDEEVVNAALKLLVASGRNDWIPAVREKLIHHPHWDVRVTFAHALADLMGSDSSVFLEQRLLVEGEDLVRQHLLDIIEGLPRGLE